MNGGISRDPRSGARDRPRVLLVDDHPLVLTAVASTLAADYDIVGTAGSGREALDMLAGVRPDAIVLDISMPGLDGFQTFDAIQQTGSRAPLVFLSMHDADDYVRAAFLRGALGYVVKSHLKRDLPIALEQALSGRLFVPSLSSLLQLADPGGHAAQFHGEIDPFVDGATDFLDHALRRGDATCVIATERLREELERRLRARGWAVGGPSGDGRYLACDVQDALSRIMRGSEPDPGRLAEIVEEFDEFRLARGEGASPRLTIFGTMVVLLHAAGNPAAAIAIENSWDAMTRGRPFLTLCAYPDSCFHESAPEVLSDTRAVHWALSHAREV